VIARRRRRRELRLGLLELVLVLVLLDGEQQVVLLDDLAVLEVDLLQIAWHAGDELDRVDRLGVAGDDERVADRLNFRQGDGDRRTDRGRRCLRRGRRSGLSRRRLRRRRRGRLGRLCQWRRSVGGRRGGGRRRRRRGLRTCFLAAAPDVAPQAFELVLG